MSSHTSVTLATGSTSQPVGLYQVVLADSPPFRLPSVSGGGLAYLHYAHVYRNGRLLTTVRARTEAAAVAEARHNVRMARKAGGL